MGLRLQVPFRAYVGAGGVLTFIGSAAGQAVYWFLEGYNPETGEVVDPVGSLRWDIRITDKSFRATNIYLAPKIDTCPVHDRVTVKVVL